MARVDSVVSFNSERHSRTVEAMRSSREDVRDRGRDTVRRTGSVHKFVDVKGRIKKSHNAIIEKDGKMVLVNGIALPIVSDFDGTASMGQNIRRFFDALGPFYELLEPIRAQGYDTQLSAMMHQDKDDTIPDSGILSAIQQTEFEQGNNIADQIRQIVYSNCGGDAPEEYQIALLQASFNDLDINRYGLKGYLFIGGDEIGRDRNTPGEIMEYLGRKVQKAMTIKQMYDAAAEKYHVYRIQCGGGGRPATRNTVTEWWEQIMGKGRVIIVEDVSLLAEVQAALVWCGETPQPTVEGLIEFIVNGTRGNVRRTEDDARKIWKWITDAGVELGVQTKLPNWGKLPEKGSVFANFRHLWPIDDPRAVENTVDAEAAPATGSTPESPKKPEREKSDTDWTKF